MARLLIICLLLAPLCGCGDPPPAPPPESHWLANDFEGPGQVRALAEAFDIPLVIEGPAGMRFHLVPAGHFEMGRGPGHALREIQIIAPYYIQEGEVTWGQWLGVRAANLSSWGPTDLPDEEVDLATPRIEVSHDSAVWFARMVGKTMNRQVRLPREAEWEFACRAGSGGAYWSGEEPPALPHAPRAGQAPLPPRLFAANPLGLRAMHGNVEEWCADWFGPYPPHATSDPVGPQTGTRRVVRGGCYSSGFEQQESGARRGLAPDTHDPGLGFRLLIESGYHGRVPLEIAAVRKDPEGKIVEQIDGFVIEMISIPERLADRQAGIKERWTLVEARSPTTLMVRPGRYYARLVDAAGHRGLELKIDVATPGPVAVNLVVPKDPNDD